MIETGWLLFGASLVSAIAAMTWSFLMAAKVAAPRAAAKSKLLLVSILTGATPEDETILETIKGKLIRPEISAALADLKVEMPALDIEPLVGPLTERMNASLDMKMKSMKGEEQNAVRRFLEEQGVNLEAAGAEAEQIMLSQLTDQQLALRKFATMKIPPAIKQNHPEWAALINEVRPLAVDLIQRRVLNGQTVQGSSGSGFNPGV